jgi:hypothetical protein
VIPDVVKLELAQKNSLYLSFVQQHPSMEDIHDIIFTTSGNIKHIYNLTRSLV